MLAHVAMETDNLQNQYKGKVLIVMLIVGKHEHKHLPCCHLDRAVQNIVIFNSKQSSNANK